MTVQIRLFAWMAQQANTSSVSLMLPEGTTLSAIRPALLQAFPNAPIPANSMLAVNRQYATEDTLLHEGDEVAIIPPVSGG